MHGSQITFGQRGCAVNYGAQGGPQVLGAIVRIEEARALGVLHQVPPARQIQQPMGQVQPSGYQGRSQAQLPQAQARHLQSIARLTADLATGTLRPMSRAGTNDEYRNCRHVDVFAAVCPSMCLRRLDQQHRPGSSTTGTEMGTPMIQPSMPPISGLLGAGPSMASQQNPAPALPLEMRAPVHKGVSDGPGGHPYAGSNGMHMSNGAVGDVQGSMGPVSAAELNLGGPDMIPRTPVQGGDDQGGQLTQIRLLFRICSNKWPCNLLFRPFLPRLSHPPVYGESLATVRIAG
ncbi:unnamed protein product [Tilletia controversa]|nr:unnamed protein product [Tilletia controversa]